VCSLGDGPLRRAIEQETDRLHEPLYRILPLPERLELLAGLGALPFRVKRCLPTPPGSLAHRSPM